MSAPLIMASSSAPPPPPRGLPFIASNEKHAYLWGGTKGTLPHKVFRYCHDEEAWKREDTKGPHPPSGLNDGGCTTTGICLYFYGGTDGRSKHGYLHELNISNWTWRKVCDGRAWGPGVQDDLLPGPATGSWGSQWRDT